MVFLTFLKFSLKFREQIPCREAASNALSVERRIFLLLSQRDILLYLSIYLFILGNSNLKLPFLGLFPKCEMTLFLVLCQIGRFFFFFFIE
jgi:hypothetical protein